MNSKEFNNLINKIEARPEFQSLTVLDRGNDMIIVHTANGLWFLYAQHSWSELSEEDAKEVLIASYFAYRFDEMKIAKI